MYVERAERLPALRDDIRGLQQVVSRCRWRLGFERLVAFGVRGLIASALVSLGVSAAAWLIAGEPSVPASEASAMAGEARFLASQTSVMSGAASFLASQTSVMSGAASFLASQTSVLAGGANVLAGGADVLTRQTSLLAGVARFLASERAWLMALPLLIALSVGLVRWPSRRQAALAADRRLALDERLGTAIEVVERIRGGRGGRFDRLQVADALERARAAPMTWLALDRRLRREAFIAAALSVVAVGAFVGLPWVPRPSLPVGEQGVVTAETALPDMADRPLPLDVGDGSVGQAQAVAQPQARTDPDLAARVQQEQAEHDALGKLSQALGRVSAAQPAADAIQRGDFSDAQQQLSNLGDEADQVSDAAKQQLAQALQQAANSTPGDRQLADRERQAAQALNRSTYADQRQALRNLADQVQRSGERSVSADQLARDQGQLQQQTAAGQTTAQPAEGSPASPAGQAGQTGRGSAQGAGQGAGSSTRSTSAGTTPDGASTDGQGAAGGQGAGTSGQQGGPGVGTGSDPQVLGDQSSRLETSGQSVTVPTKLGAGRGIRPPDGSEDQLGNNPTPGGQTVSELAQTQQTGQVVPEQNLVPGEQRPVVRGYFR